MNVIANKISHILFVLKQPPKKVLLNKQTFENSHKKLQKISLHTEIKRILYQFTAYKRMNFFFCEEQNEQKKILRTSKASEVSINEQTFIKDIMEAEGPTPAPRFIRY